MSVQPPAGTAVPRPQVQALRWLLAMILAWPALIALDLLVDALRTLGSGWLVSGAWAIPVALAIASAISWRLFHTTAPGLVGWGLGLALLAVARLLDPDIGRAGLLTALVIQGPIAITLVQFIRARTRRRGEAGAPMGIANAVLISWGLGLACCACTHEWRWGVFGLGMLALSLAGAGLARAMLPRPGRLPADVPTVLNTLFGYGTFVICCLSLPLLLPLVLPLALARPVARYRVLATAMRRGMTTVLFCAPTVGWRYDGELQALAGAQVVVANHEGMLDILAVCSMPGTRTLLAKTWVFRAFPLGLAARAAGLRNSDLLEADDYQGNAALTTSAQDGAGILVFPEGRRSRTGAVHRFRPGAFVLAKALGAPVVPMAIAGSRQGIRPDGMWIHPTILHCRVLPPMRQQADESHRQVAERCRVAIAAARCALMREHVATPRMIANRLHHFTGLGGRLARAIRSEQQEGGWRQMAVMCGESDLPWLFLGCGWSTRAVTLRQLLPTPAIIAVDSDPEHRAVASCAWFQPGLDRLLPAADTALLPERLAGVVCQLRHDHPIVQTLWSALAGRVAVVALVPAVDVAVWLSAGWMHSADMHAAGPVAGLVALVPGRSG